MISFGELVSILQSFRKYCITFKWLVYELPASGSPFFLSMDCSKIPVSGTPTPHPTSPAC